MNARDEIFSIIGETGLPCWKMHEMPAETVYPSSFFTYLCESAPFAEYYDNKPHAVLWTFGIGFYSNDPRRVESETSELVKRLLSAGWIVDGAGEDVQSDEPTHTGRRVVAQKIDYFESEV